MGRRLKLQTILEKVLGSRNVYFQPPATIQMKYPCIVYELSSMDIRHANDDPYIHRRRYKITVVDRNPDSDIPNRISMLRTVSFDRHYTQDNLHHFVFNLYY